MIFTTYANDLEAPLKGKKSRRRRSPSQGHQQQSRGGDPLGELEVVGEEPELRESTTAVDDRGGEDDDCDERTRPPCSIRRT